MSKVVFIERASSTVIAPSFPALSTAVAIRLPMVLSPLAEMVAMCSMSSLVLIGWALSLRRLVITSTAFSIPRLSSTGDEPARTYCWAVL